MTEETTPQSTEPQTFGWVAGLPIGLQDHPENRRRIQQRQLENAQKNENS